MPPVVVSCPIAGAAAPAASRSVPAYWLEGAGGYDDAVRARQVAAGPMVLYFFTDWCGYCKRFEQQLLSSVEMDRYFSRQTLRVRINPERGPADRALANSLDVSGYPTFLVVPAGGTNPEDCSPYRSGTQLLSPREFADRIEAANRRQLEQLLSDAKRRVSAGDPAGAVAVLDKAAAAAPDDVDVYEARAAALERSGEVDRALLDYATIAALRPDDARPFERATRALLGGQRFDEAVACSTDWLGRHPRSGPFYLARAEAHRGRGDTVSAREDAQMACTLGDSTACRWSSR